MDKEIIEKIKIEISHKINKEQLISTKLIKEIIFVKYGIDLEVNDIYSFLIKDSRLIEISNGLFIPIKILEQFKGNIKEMKEYIKEKFFVVNPNLTNVICTLNINLYTNKFEAKNMIGQIDRELLKLVDYFEKYYKKNKKAVQIDSRFFTVFEEIESNVLQQLLNNTKIFYQLSKKRFGLIKWLLDELYNYFETNNQPLDSCSIEEIARKVFGFHNVNKKNLVNIFLKDKNILDKYGFLELNAEFENYFKDLFKNINKNERELTLKEFLSEPRSVNEIVDKFKLSRKIGQINKLEVYLCKQNNIMIDSNDMYYFSDDKETIQSLIKKVYVKHRYLINNLTIEDLVCTIMKAKNESILLCELYEEIKCFIDLTQNDLVNLLNGSKKFIRTGYNEWFLNETNRYPIFKADINLLLNDIKKEFSEKYWSIFSQYVLTTEKTTLEEIGTTLKLSRERVRQILKKIRRKFVHHKYKQMILPYIKAFDLIFKRNQVISIKNIMSSNIYKEIFKEFDVRKLVRFINWLDIKGYNGFTIFYDYYISKIDNETFGLITDYLKKQFIKEEIQLINIKDVYKFFFDFKIKDKNFINSFIEKDKNLLFLEKDNFVVIKKQRVCKSDIVWYILKKFGKPMHYSEIAAKYREITGEKDIKDRNILALLERATGVVRIFSGLFALREWGVIPHRHTRDWNYKVLKEKGRPMHYTEIFQEVSKYTFSKEKTVYQYLTLDDRIFSFANGYYGLKEWLNDKNKVQQFNITKELFEKNNRSKKLIRTFVGESGYQISKYCLTENALKNGYLNIDKNLRDNLKEYVFVIDCNNKKYLSKYSSKTGNLYRLTSLFRNKNLKPGEYIYLEFITTEVIRLLNKDEFDNYQAPDLSKINIFKSITENLNKKDIKRQDIKTVEDLKSFGLKYGFVYYEDIEKIIEDLEDVNDLLDELSDMGIVFKRG